MLLFLKETVEGRFIKEHPIVNIDVFCDNIDVYHDTELNVTCYSTSIGLSCIPDAEIERSQKMVLTMKILIAMCVQAIIGAFITFYINVTIGLVITWFAAAVNSMILLFVIIEWKRRKR